MKINDPFIVVRRSEVYAPAWVTPWLIALLIVVIPLIGWAIAAGIRSACS